MIPAGQISFSLPRSLELPIFQSTVLENTGRIFEETLLGNEIESEYHNGET